MKKYIYIASRKKDGGLYKFSNLYDEKYEFIDFTPVDSPMYMKIVDEKMYVILRSPFANGHSGVCHFEISDQGKLINQTEIISTEGKVACHLEICDDAVYCVNYSSGNFKKVPGPLIVYAEEGKTSHPHYVGKTPDGLYLCVTDLGLDKIYIYDMQMGLKNVIPMPHGCGVRHIAFSECGKYAFTSNELDSTVSVLRYRDGNMDLIDTIRCLPPDFDGDSAAAAIRVYDNKIYVSNRGHDSISELSFDGKQLKLTDNFKCLGNGPRDFIFHENQIVCANQNSNNVTVFEKDENKSFVLIQEIQIEEPICVVCK